MRAQVAPRPACLAPGAGAFCGRAANVQSRGLSCTVERDSATSLGRGGGKELATVLAQEVVACVDGVMVMHIHPITSPLGDARQALSPLVGIEAAKGTCCPDHP
eukprot:CAMPEP_0115870794 /NCGR_PEP_ID=MMETSP0287-20121206/22522_1 /TAXON_ID=412157 /ORGANISM="Chrysochromulina rotalis, Strain UIO044" /LENGTH=103 /DNA_ID=CAMNT_0003325551 /DNA_START=754 /DNA_END=1064 /DNA_ORIENTATION=+